MKWNHDHGINLHPKRNEISNISAIFFIDIKRIQIYLRGRQKSEDRQDYGQLKETKDKHRTYNTTLKTKAWVTQKYKANCHKSTKD